VSKKAAGPNGGIKYGNVWAEICMEIDRETKRERERGERGRGERDGEERERERERETAKLPNIPEDGRIQINHRESLRSSIALLFP
jgi:hypothetical protein